MSTGLRTNLRLTIIAAFSLGLAMLALSGFIAPVKGHWTSAVSACCNEDERGSANGVAETAAVMLQGKVLSADGSPASGAVVWVAKLDIGLLERQETVADETGRYALTVGPGEWFLWARRGTQGSPHQSKGLKIQGGQVPKPVTIRLEEHGTFRVRIVEAESSEPISGAQLFLDGGLVLSTGEDGWATLGGLTREGHEGFIVAPGRMRMRVLFDTTARAETELEVPVPRGGKIVGRVTDLEGRAIPGAYVGNETSGSYFSTNARYQACESDGRFEYDDGVPPDQPTRLAAYAPGYIHEQRADFVVPSAGKAPELQFRLRPEPTIGAGAAKSADDVLRTISGIVTGSEGKPVSGVLIRWGYDPFVGARETHTNAEGRFDLDVPSKANVVAVLPREFLPQFPAVPGGGNHTVKIVLQKGRIARGRVVDDAGKPVEGVEVLPLIGSPDPRILSEYWLEETSVRTDSTGKFELKGIPDGALFDFLKHGMSDIRHQHLGLDSADYKSTVKMQYGGALCGRVLDRNGKPIRNFRVLLNRPRNAPRGGAFFAGFFGIGVRFTSADGSFVLTGIDADSAYRVNVLATGHGEAVADPVQAVPLNHLAGATPVTLRAGPPQSLRVRATTSDDRPVAGARVTLVYGEPTLANHFVWGQNDGGWWNMVPARTALDGWADFPNLGFSEAVVLVQVPGYARQHVWWEGGRKEFTIPLAPEAVFRGEVCDAAGAFLKKCSVKLISDRDQLSTRINPEDKGCFRIAELPAGSWRLMVRGEDSRDVLHQDKVTLQAGETQELKIKLKK